MIFNQIHLINKQKTVQEKLFYQIKIKLNINFKKYKLTNNK